MTSEFKKAADRHYEIVDYESKYPWYLKRLRATLLEHTTTKHIMRHANQGQYHADIPRHTSSKCEFSERAAAEVNREDDFPYKLESIRDTDNSCNLRAVYNDIALKDLEKMRAVAPARRTTIAWWA